MLAEEAEVEEVEVEVEVEGWSGCGVGRLLDEEVDRSIIERE
jgi:hypothetical protein